MKYLQGGKRTFFPDSSSEDSETRMCHINQRIEYIVNSRTGAHNPIACDWAEIYTEAVQCCLFKAKFSLFMYIQYINFEKFLKMIAGTIKTCRVLQTYYVLLNLL